MFVNATTDIGRVSTKVFASRRAVEIKGSWYPIDDLLHVRKEGDGYRVVLEPNQSLGIPAAWISIKPDKPADSLILRKSMRDEHVDSWHFGPRLRIADLDEGSINFKLDMSVGVALSAGLDSLFFEAVPDLGLSFDRWSDLLGEDLTKDFSNGLISLNLTNIRNKRLDEVSGTGKTPEDLDLDPETVLVDMQSGYSYKAEDVGATGTWATVRDASEGEPTAELKIYNIWLPSTTLLCTRMGINFDVFGLSFPSSAFVWLYRGGGAYTDLRIIHGNFPCTSSAVFYGLILSNALAGKVIGGDWSPSGNWSKSPDIMAAGGWQNGGIYGILNNSNDLLNGMESGDVYTATFDLTGDNAPYLELFYPSSANSSGTGTGSSTNI